MKHSIVKAVLLSTILLGACSSRFEIEGFSSENWKSDWHGCKGLRSNEIEVLLNARNNILGQSERDIIKVLGAPDGNQIYPRNQKFFIYYIEPGPECEEGGEAAERLSLRINALGKVHEMFLYE